MNARLPFTAILLAGGASRRMGMDKALVPVTDAAGSPRPLWRHQLATLQALAPVEILVSGPPRPDFPATMRCVPDGLASGGPLAGIAACLALVTTRWAVVLAIDLPRMTPGFLDRLLRTAVADGQGAVPRGPYHYEPLAAVYPQAAADVAGAALKASRLRLQDFVDELIAAALVRPFPLKPGDLRLFTNWNATADLA